MAQAPQKQAQDTLRQSHQVAQQALGMASNALSRVHSDVQGAQTPDDRHQQLLDAIGSLGQQQQASPPGGGDGYGQMVPDSQQQAVWSEFPGTDPNAVDNLMAQNAGDPGGALGPLFHLFQADEEHLAQMHQMILDHILSILSAPQGGPQMPTVASPEVGGDHIGIG